MSTIQEKTVAARKKAVLSRLAGATLMQAAQQSGLSTTTVSALVDAYKKGGWRAVESRKRGRPQIARRSLTQGHGDLRSQFLAQRLAGRNFGPVFSVGGLAAWLSEHTAAEASEPAALRKLFYWGLLPPDRALAAGTLLLEDNSLIYWARGPRREIFVMVGSLPITEDAYCTLFIELKNNFPSGLAINLCFAGLSYTPKLKSWLDQNCGFNLTVSSVDHCPALKTSKKKSPMLQEPNETKQDKRKQPPSLTHLQRLEAESIAIMREVVAEADNPVMLYSIGKDSAVMLRLALKAFYPAKIPFPLLHVDTTWKFQDMYRFRAKMQKEHDFELLVHTNEEGLKQGINPFTHGSQIHTDIMKTVSLKQALEKHGFDVAFGGARRDEEKSRAKERIFSFRTTDHRWDPKNQRPELWNLYNTKKHKGESIRVFPISNWTELDVWQYIYLENIPIVPLYYSAPRPVVSRDGTLIMVDDDRMPLGVGEVPMIKSVRFRTLGCYPLTGAVESQAVTLEDIIQETLLAKTSERQGRMIDHDTAASMEKKKQEGYF